MIVLSGCAAPVAEARITQSVLPDVVALTTPTDAVIQAISPVSSTLVWASGHKGVVLRSTNRGDSWTLVPTPVGDSLQFRDIAGISADEAIILSAGTGTDSRIYRTTDGGTSWALAYGMSHPDGFLDCMDFWDNGAGFAFGDTVDGSPFVLRTQDRGETWTRVAAEDLPEVNEGEGGFAASGTCALAGPNGMGWIGTGASGSARVFTTSDFGASWNASTVPIVGGSAAGVFSLTRSNGSLVALGGDLSTDAIPELGAAVSRDQGTTWERTVSAPIPGAVYGAAAGGPESGIIVATSPKGTAVSGDLGASWASLPTVQGWAVAFATDSKVGWAAGTQGRMWRLTLP